MCNEFSPKSLRAFTLSALASRSTAATSSKEFFFVEIILNEPLQFEGF